MTLENKELLRREICARWPYGVKICHIEPEYKAKSTWDIDFIYPNGNIVCKHPCYAVHGIENCRLYLRPMSSMTDEEREELEVIFDEYDNPCTVDEDGCLSFYGGNDFLSPEDLEIYVDFCYQHHLDYRGLIEKGLALEAPEGMYKVNGI